MTDYKCRCCRDTGKFYVVTAGGDEVLCDCECTRKGLEHLPLEAQDRIISLRQEIDRVTNDYAEWMSPEDYVPLVQKVNDLASLVRILVHSLRKVNPNSSNIILVMDYLKRKGLTGSILRSDEPHPDPLSTNGGAE